MASGDTAVIERIIADDFIGVDPQGKTYGKASMVADTRKAPQFFLSNRLNDVKVRFYGDTAIAQGSESWERRSGARGRFVWTDTWLRRDAQWQIVAAEDLQLTDVAAPDREAELATEKLEQAWAQVDVNRDTKLFERILAPDFVATTRSGKFLASRAAYVADWEYESVRRAELRELHAHSAGPAVVVVTGIDATFGDNPDGTEWSHEDRFTDTWVKRDERWQCVAAQVLRLK